jgi:hypothetical protein
VPATVADHELVERQAVPPVLRDEPLVQREILRRGRRVLPRVALEDGARVDAERGPDLGLGGRQ